MLGAETCMQANTCTQKMMRLFFKTIKTIKEWEQQHTPIMPALRKLGQEISVCSCHPRLPSKVQVSQGFRMIPVSKQLQQQIN